MNLITLYRDEQVNTISYNINIPKTVVRTVISSYADYVKQCIISGESSRFLSICEFRVNRKSCAFGKTLAYVSNELATKLNLSPIIVNGILSAYETYMIDDLKHGFTYNIRGLFTIRLINNCLSIDKSFSLSGTENSVRVMLLGRFKRKFAA